VKKWFEQARQVEKDLKIIVVRNPINRFVSVLNHPLIFDYIDTDYSMGRIDKLLDYLENNGMDNGHFLPQSNQPKAYFTNIVRVEGGDLIKQLNEITGIRTEDYFLNSIEDKLSNPNNYEFDYRQLDIIKPEHLTKQQESRIRELYKSDFTEFYD